jgi:BirA family biotin operon repressor/biotin-[acetyl-CoA-carboxylase] ligase
MVGENPGIINPDHIAGELVHRGIFPDYEWLFYESIGSTNDVARLRLQESRDPKVIVVCARQQTNGRGRGMNRWIGTGPNNVYLSFGFPAEVDSLSRFPTILADGIVRRLQDVFSVDLAVKAPNDLLLDGKKVGGILVEIPAEIPGWVLGVGLNLFSDPELQGQCAQPVGAIDLVKNLPPDAVILELCAIVAELEDEMGKNFSAKM